MDKPATATTSGTGISSSKPATTGPRRGRPGSAPRDAGFTLLEILVVLVIIGIVVGMLTLSIGGHDAKAVVGENADRLAALINTASDQAVLSEIQYGVRFTADGYQFLKQDGDKWKPVSGDELLRPRRLDAGVALHLQVDGQIVALTDETPEGSAPHVFLYSSGEHTPFAATLSTPSGDDPFRVVGALTGKVHVVAPDSSGPP